MHQALPVGSDPIHESAGKQNEVIAWTQARLLKQALRLNQVGSHPIPGCRRWNEDQAYCGCGAKPPEFWRVKTMPTPMRLQPLKFGRQPGGERTACRTDDADHPRCRFSHRVNCVG